MGHSAADGLHPRQAAAHAVKVGGSEVGILLGDPYRPPYAGSTPADLYARKKLGRDRLDSAAMAAGRWWERQLIRHLATELGVRIRPATWPYSHRLLPLCANVDGVTLDPVDGAIANVEVKFVSSFLAPDWADGVPPYVRAQVQTGLLLSGRELGIVGAMIGGPPLRVFREPADPELQARILEVVTRFAVEHLDPGIPPPLDPELAPEDLVLSFADWPRDTIVAGGDLADVGDALATAARVRLEAEHAEAALRPALVAAVAAAGAREVVAPGRWSATVRELRDGRPSLTFRPRSGGTS